MASPVLPLPHPVLSDLVLRTPFTLFEPPTGHSLTESSRASPEYPKNPSVPHSQKLQWPRFPPPHAHPQGGVKAHAVAWPMNSPLLYVPLHPTWVSARLPSSPKPALIPALGSQQMFPGNLGIRQVLSGAQNNSENWQLDVSLKDPPATP